MGGIRANEENEKNKDSQRVVLSDSFVRMFGRWLSR